MKWCVSPIPATGSLTSSIKLPGGEITNLFFEGRPIENAPPIELVLVTPGVPMDFGFSVMGVPLVSDRAARLLQEVAPKDVQLIRSTVPGHGACSAVNLLRMLDCVDEKLTKHIGKGGPLDYYVLAGDFFIDPERTDGSQIFRLLRQHHTVVIGEQLKEAIFKEKLVGPGLFALDGSRETLMPGFERNLLPERRKRTKAGAAAETQVNAAGKRVGSRTALPIGPGSTAFDLEIRPKRASRTRFD